MGCSDCFVCGCCFPPPNASTMSNSLSSRIRASGLYLSYSIFAGKTLEDQGVTHNAKVMVLQLEQSDEETKRRVQEEELQCKKEKEINDKMQRTKKGLEILAERGTTACLGFFCGMGEDGCSLIFAHQKISSH